ncbi:MAG: pre-16S rRNA-processing nuclease YqgF [Firmicutes bacterium]|jgi:RNase H-fold protein (predicted Holliday junction resolvase)|nr:pre-16S rRNA-processing nuclease YqgF [Bacillota bacterium]
MSQVIMAVDPGRRKFGYAVLEKDKSKRVSVLRKGVAPAEEVEQVVQEICTGFPVAAVVVGDKTGSREMLARVVTALHGQAAVVRRIDEAYSTLEGRRRYLQEHRRGWRRLLPLGLQAPPEPYDDYVAVVLGERFFAKEKAAAQE